MNKRNAKAMGSAYADEGIRYGDWTAAELATEDSFWSAVAEWEECRRQYSDFSHLASEINKCPNADGLWEAFDEGQNKAFARFYARQERAVA